ncbi:MULTISPECIES: ribosome maturation factor RimM [Rhodomicrobium]|uniref:ribosome maturation factor RimM n=1 Tax=Rhodomicrobium TaxID=1068 RepID=UPI000B4BB05D|nr:MULTISPECIES: ribosome maturation factor RimM [Rhodomicrobium]
MDKTNGRSSDATSSLVLLGRIAGAHGLRGEVKINSFTAAPEDIAAYGPLTDPAGRSFTIRSLRPLKGGAVTAQLAGISTRDAAEALRGTELYIEREKLPEPDPDEWYYEDLIGMAAVSPEGAPIGEIVAVQNFGAGDLLEIRSPDARQTLFVPFTEATVPVVDIEARQVTVLLPEEIDDKDE